MVSHRLCCALLWTLFALVAAMPSAECDGAFAVDQAGEIGGIYWREAMYSYCRTHDSSSFSCQRPENPGPCGPGRGLVEAAGIEPASASPTLQDLHAYPVY